MYPSHKEPKNVLITREAIRDVLEDVLLANFPQIESDELAFVADEMIYRLEDKGLFDDDLDEDSDLKPEEDSYEPFGD